MFFRILNYDSKKGLHTLMSNDIAPHAKHYYAHKSVKTMLLVPYFVEQNVIDVSSGAD